MSTTKCTSIVQRTGLRCKHPTCKYSDEYCGIHYKVHNRCKETCAICLDEIEHQVNWKTTKCGHHYHIGCFYKLTMEHQNLECPLCRSMLYRDVSLPPRLVMGTINLDDGNYNCYSINAFDVIGTVGVEYVKRRNVKHRTNALVKELLRFHERRCLSEVYVNNKQARLVEDSILKTYCDKYMIVLIYDGFFVEDGVFLSDTPKYIQHFMYMEHANMEEMNTRLEFLCQEVFLR